MIVLIPDHGLSIYFPFYRGVEQQTSIHDGIRLVSIFVNVKLLCSIL